jgi:hypothetical protein
MLLPTCCCRPRRVTVRPNRHLRGDWSVDIDAPDPSVLLQQRSPTPPAAVASSRSSAQSGFYRPRPVRTVPRRVGTFLQGVQAMLGRPIEVFARTPGAMPDIESDDEGECEAIAGAHSRQGSHASLALSDQPPPLPPKDGASFWTKIKLPTRFGGSSAQGSQAYDAVNLDEDETVVIHNGGAESGHRDASSAVPGASTRNVQHVPLSGGQPAGPTSSTSGNLARRQPNASSSSLSLSNLAEAAKASLKRQGTAASKRRPKGSRLGKRKSALSDRGAPYGRSRTNVTQEDDEDDPADERRNLDDAVTESTPSEFFEPPTGIRLSAFTYSPTEWTGEGSDGSGVLFSRGGRKISLTNSQESSSAAARSAYMSRVGSSRTGTTNTFSSRDRRSLEVYPPTPVELDGVRPSFTLDLTVTYWALTAALLCVPLRVHSSLITSFNSPSTYLWASSDHPISVRT